MTFPGVRIHQRERTKRSARSRGLLHEIHLDVASLLLGDGKPLFDHLDPEPIELERLHVVEGPDVTHIGFRIIT
jgi:hypothetical protein